MAVEKARCRAATNTTIGTREARQCRRLRQRCGVRSHVASRKGTPTVSSCALPIAAPSVESLEIVQPIQEVGQTGDALPCTTTDTNPELEVPRQSKRVRFDLDANEMYEITAYAEIYGIHPRYFDFDRGFWMVPAKGFSVPCANEDDEEEEKEEAEDSEGEEEDEWDIVEVLDAGDLAQTQSPEA